MKFATKKPPLRSSAQNLGTLPSRLRSTSSSWIPKKLFPRLKPLQIISQVNFCASETVSLTWGCVSIGSDFRNTRTGRLTLTGLFHQKTYITKFMAGYASVTISRCVTGRCSTACAMHCTRRLEQEGRFSELIALSPVLDFRFSEHGGWGRGLSSSCDMRSRPLLT